MLIKELLVDFVKENKIVFIFFLIITLLTFPLESIIIPELYSNLYIGIKNNPGKAMLKKIGFYILVIVVTWLLIQLFNFGRNYLNSRLLPKYFEFISKKLFNKLVLSYETNYKNVEISNNVVKIFDFTFEIKDFLNFCFIGLIPLLLAIIVISIYLLFIDWQIGLIVIVLLLVLVFVSKHYANNAINISEQREKRFINLFDNYHDSLNNLINIYLNSEVETQLEKSGKVNADHTDYYENQMKQVNKMIAVFSIISLIMFAVVITKSYFNLKSGKFNGKKFITITLIIIYFLGFLMQIVTWSPDEIMRLGTIKHSLGYVKELLKHKDKNYIDHNLEYGDIEFNNVSFKYDESDTWVCKNLSFKINKGQKVSLVGSSGMGKSTLMQLLLGLIQPNDGEILINNIKVNEINPRHLRKRCCFINQDTNLFNGTVIENIKYGNNSSDNKIISILKKYDILKHFDKLDKGIYSDVGYQGKNLSGGMRKIVINMRAVLKDSDIYIFDEPLTALDVECRNKMIKLIKDVSEGKTLIIITHDKEIFKITDKIINLDEILKK